MSKLKNFCKNISIKSKRNHAKRKTAKLEKRMNKLAEKQIKSVEIATTLRYLQTKYTKSEIIACT